MKGELQTLYLRNRDCSLGECNTTQSCLLGRGVLRGSYQVPETSVCETASLQGEKTSCGGLETVSIEKMSAMQNVSDDIYIYHICHLPLI